MVVIIKMKFTVDADLGNLDQLVPTLFPYHQDILSCHLFRLCHSSEVTTQSSQVRVKHLCELLGSLLHHLFLPCIYLFIYINEDLINFLCWIIFKQLFVTLLKLCSFHPQTHCELSLVYGEVGDLLENLLVLHDASKLILNIFYPNCKLDIFPGMPGFIQVAICLTQFLHPPI